MRATAAAVIAFFVFMSCAEAGVRLKDIVSITGVRDQQLVGYGLVVGLQGTGDSLRNAPFTEQSMQSMLDRMGVAIKSGTLRTRNVAAVIVTADLPPFVGLGSRIDVTVSALGDATSLMGGTLVLTPLVGVDGATYAVSQGAVAVSGFAAQGQAETVTQGVPTVGRISNGAMVEREVVGRIADGPLVLELKNADFKTALAMVDVVNRFSIKRYNRAIAREIDHRRIAVEAPKGMSRARLMAEIGDIIVEPDVPARVVVDARTGTVVIGHNVRVSAVAVTHGNITVRITETPQVSQPAPLSRGQTAVVPQTTVDVDQAGGRFAIVEGVSLQSLVRGLNQIGAKPSGIIAIIQAIKSAGALQADLVVQ